MAQNDFIEILRAMLWEKIKKIPASEREETMTLVIGTVGTIDPNSLCEDTACDQHGEPMKDHRVTHKNKGSARGLRGTCPHCQGRMHNSNDAAQLIAFQCLWKQAFGEAARKTPVDANTLAYVANSITTTKITAWADRALTHTATLPKASAPSFVAPAPAVAPIAIPPSTTVPGVTSAGLVVPPTPAPAIGKLTSPPTMTADQIAEKRRKIRAALKDARVQP